MFSSLQAAGRVVIRALGSQRALSQPPLRDSYQLHSATDEALLPVAVGLDLRVDPSRDPGPPQGSGEEAKVPPEQGPTVVPVLRIGGKPLVRDVGTVAHPVELGAFRLR
jgi:hypothetical protein